MIQAHGATVTVSGSVVQIHRDLLHASLEGPADPIAISDISDVTVEAGEAPFVSSVQIVLNDQSRHEILFPPGAAERAESFADDVKRIVAGETVVTDLAGCPGLNATVLLVQAPAGDWAHPRTVVLGEMTDGVIADQHRFSFIGDDKTDAATLKEVFALLEKLTSNAGKATGGLVVADNFYRACTVLKNAAHRLGVTPGYAVGVCVASLRQEIDQLPGYSAASARVILDPSHQDDSKEQLTAIAAACCRYAAHLDASATAGAAENPLLNVMAAHHLIPGEMSGAVVRPVMRRVDFLVHHTMNGPHQNLPLAMKLAGDPAGGSTTSDAASAAEEQQPVAEAKPAPRRRRTNWERAATPDEIPEPNKDADPEGPLFGETVVLSGEFGAWDKGDLWRRIAERGGIIGKNVTKKTTILVVGAWESKTSKVTKAEEYQAKGQAIAFWSGEDLLRALGIDDDAPIDPMDLEPPF